MGLNVKLGDWSIVTSFPLYNIWLSPDNDKAIIEYDHEKIAVIALGDKGEIKTQSINAYISINSNNHVIKVGYPDDKNLGSVYQIY